MKRDLGVAVTCNFSAFGINFLCKKFLECRVMAHQQVSKPCQVALSVFVSDNPLVLTVSILSEIATWKMSRSSAGVRSVYSTQTMDLLENALCHFGGNSFLELLPLPSSRYQYFVFVYLIFNLGDVASLSFLKRLTRQHLLISVLC